ncbi:MAG: T9SS type A sorting domain-containing protein [Saprospiraceae bacterium]|nr:T9SS type A sorting domain-containing protein [Saprospiraceae bacterium]
MKIMTRASRTVSRYWAIAAMMLTLSSTLSAQFHTLTVNGVDYPLLRAAFGDCSTGSFAGEWVIAQDGTSPLTDGCEAITSNVAGKVALIDRGGCNFDVKCLNAQNAGATAVIVCNNTTATTVIQMSNVSVGGQVTIPCFMLSKPNCDALRLLTPINVAIAPDEPELVVWGNQPGEGDFNGGLNGWEINNISCANGAQEFDLWRYSANNTVTGGAFGDGTLTSRTACNGAMVFNSDLYDSNGDEMTPGQGPCTVVQEGELISPAIDLSNTSVAGVSLQFTQLTRQFTSQYFVGYSINNGQDWTEVEINTELPVNSNAIISTIRLPIPGAVGSSQVRIKFRYLANYYYWAIDDVRLIEQEANNMRVNENFFAIAQNAATPLAMAEPIHFLADISNVGASTQTGVTLNMSIVKDAGPEVFNDDLDYNQVNGNTIVENIPFGGSFTPTEMGSYTGTYTISADAADFDPSDNALSFEFLVTENAWAKELGETRNIVPADNNWDTGEAHSWAYGNHFFVPALSMPYAATSCSFSLIGTGLAGETPQLTLYQWTDTNNDGNVQDTERTFVTFASYLIEGNETEDQLITLDFDEPALLENNTHYLLMLEYTAPDDETDLFLGASEAFDYGAMVFLNGPEVLARPRFASMLAIGDPSTAEFSSNGFGRDIVPVVRLNVEPATGTKDPLTANNVVAVYPNPVQDVLNVDFDLEQMAQNLNIRILDVAGKVVLERQLSQTQKDNLEFKVKEFAAGSYQLQLTTETGTTSRRFVIAK